MSSTQSQSIDDLFDRLLTMGFAYEDCQQAVSAGLLSVQEAVEWILGGKPSQGAAGPTLQLRKSTKSIFDSSGLPISSENGQIINNREKQGPFIADAEPEVKVKGTIRSEEQRKEWDRFHEKQRVADEKIAKIERLKKRKEHSDVLQQIALDRMEKKQLHDLARANSHASECINKENPEIVKMPSPNTLPARTMIQLRCPNGSVRKQEFDCSDTLGRLWDMMKLEFPDSEEISFLQPFPRHQYSAQDLTKTFLELGLVPSGSLVLNTQRSNVPSAVPQHPPSPPIVMNRRRRRAAPALVEVPRQQRMEEDAIFGLPGQGNAGLPPLREPGLQNLMADMHQVLENAGLGHVWGAGHKLDNREDNEEVHHNQNPLDLAREAALNRAVNREPDIADIDDSVTLTPNNSVTSLVQLCIRMIVKEILNPCTCSAGLTLPASVAERILHYMKKELVLSPKTFQAFLSCHLDCVVLDFYPYATNELLYALRLHTTIRHLSLASCPLINDNGLQNLMPLKRILSLNLRECSQITDSAFQYFSELPQLTSLNLEGTKITDAGLQSYIARKPVCLQNLNLSRTLITDKALESLSELTALRSLSLDETQVSCLRHLCPLKNLEALSIRATPVLPISLVYLKELPKLNTLNISQLPNVGGDQALELIKDLKLTSLQLPCRLTTSDVGLTFIKEMPLSSLDLTNYIHVTDFGVQCLRNMSSLKVLLLSNTKLTDVGLMSLRGLQNLEVLYLDRTAITDGGMLVFQDMASLTELSLAFTSTGKVYLKEGLLNCCKLLSRLNLSYTQVTDKGLRNLCLPNLSLISLDGTRLRGDPHQLLRGCPKLGHISAKNIEPRGLYDSDND